jgi:hypothetical protein
MDLKRSEVVDHLFQEVVGLCGAEAVVEVNWVRARLGVVCDEQPDQDEERRSASADQENPAIALEGVVHRQQETRNCSHKGKNAHELGVPRGGAFCLDRGLVLECSNRRVEVRLGNGWHPQTLARVDAPRLPAGKRKLMDHLPALVTQPLGSLRDGSSRATGAPRVNEAPRTHL